MEGLQRSDLERTGSEVLRRGDTLMTIGTSVPGTPMRGAVTPGMRSVSPGRGAGINIASLIAGAKSPAGRGRGRGRPQGVNFTPLPSPALKFASPASVMKPRTASPGANNILQKAFSGAPLSPRHIPGKTKAGLSHSTIPSTSSAGTPPMQPASARRTLADILPPARSASPPVKTVLVEGNGAAAEVAIAVTQSEEDVGNAVRSDLQIDDGDVVVFIDTRGNEVPLSGKTAVAGARYTCQLRDIPYAKLAGMLEQQYSGLDNALVTLTTADGNIDSSSLRAFLRRLGLHSIVGPLFATLRDDEGKINAKEFAHQLRPRVPFVPSVSDLVTADLTVPAGGGDHISKLKLQASPLAEFSTPASQSIGVSSTRTVDEDPFETDDEEKVAADSLLLDELRREREEKEKAEREREEREAQEREARARDRELEKEREKETEREKEREQEKALEKEREEERERELERERERIREEEEKEREKEKERLRGLEAAKEREKEVEREREEQRKAEEERKTQEVRQQEDRVRGEQPSEKRASKVRTGRQLWHIFVGQLRDTGTSVDEIKAADDTQLMALLQQMGFDLMDSLKLKTVWAAEVGHIKGSGKVEAVPSESEMYDTVHEVIMNTTSTEVTVTKMSQLVGSKHVMSRYDTERQRMAPELQLPKVLYLATPHEHVALEEFVESGFDSILAQAGYLTFTTEASPATHASLLLCEVLTGNVHRVADTTHLSSLLASPFYDSIAKDYSYVGKNGKHDVASRYYVGTPLRVIPRFSVTVAREMQLSPQRPRSISPAADRQTIVRCPHHPSEELRLYCHTDQELTCALCASIGKHANKHCVSLVELLKSMRGQFVQNEKLVGTRLGKLEAGAARLKSQEKSMVEAVQDTKRALRSRAAGVHSEVDAQESLLAGNFERKEREAAHQFAEASETIKQQIDNLKTAQDCLRSLLDTGIEDTGVSHKAGDIISLCKVLDTSAPVHPPSCEGVVDAFTAYSQEQVSSFKLVPLQT